MQIQICIQFNVSSTLYVNFHLIHTSISTSAICGFCFSCEKKHLWLNIDKFLSIRSTSIDNALLQKSYLSTQEIQQLSVFVLQKRCTSTCKLTILLFLQRFNYSSFSIHKCYLILIFTIRRNQTPLVSPKYWRLLHTSKLPFFSY